MSEPLKQGEMPLVLRISPAKICAGKKPRTSKAAPEDGINRMSTADILYTYISIYNVYMLNGVQIKSKNKCKIINDFNVWR